MAAKLLLLLGLGAGALILGSGTAHAEGAPTVPGVGPEPHPQGFDVNAPPADVLKLIATAASSANPALMRSTADHLDELGYHPQAKALRAAADAIDIAVKALPPIGATPPIGPVQLPPPGGNNFPPIVLPPLVIPATPPSGADPVAAKLTAQLNLTDPIANGRTPANGQNDLVTKFQAQEKNRGTYTGALDGMFGPGVAMAVAGYNIVPYPPFYWSSNKTKTASMKANFKAAMLKKAASDPTRADEWAHVARAAQNT
jgi:hypothetical protein